MTFAAKLKAVRRRIDRSQAGAAKLVRDLSKRTLQAWEAGQSEPPKWAQWLLLEKLKVKPVTKRRKPRRKP